ncbi:hypothetical protein PPERSA_11630 [Pseudocohnilembus persalinus]|uniref:Tubulin-tyrosine ligase/Tubulin polyglutamylase n=1 Tax=Pseudocohnilembus persalinus TaxID=266149 RepID=A0A0V0QA10_PSEPJ|nr:hypothetical protein PPERSA_11630 [Pseudocohnilembus persalinus]|eukprot:KRW99029.1 hypothetical protein PPERSA_11630 [Pseudocohnilembus persalinus]
MGKKSQQKQLANQQNQLKKPLIILSILSVLLIIYVYNTSVYDLHQFENLIKENEIIHYCQNFSQCNGSQNCQKFMTHCNECQDYKLVSDPRFQEWDFKWDFYHFRLNYSKNKTFQIGNKIQNLQDLLGEKINFLELLKNFDKKQTQYKLKSSKFIPQTYVVNLRNQSIGEDEQKLYDTNQKYWIFKDPSKYGGEGIVILETMKEIKDYIKNLKTNIKNNILPKQQTKNQKIDYDVIVQKYIENPLLLQNRKFDIRNFVLVASTEPFLVLFNDGYIRKTIENFDMNIKPFNQQVQLKHLTNTSMQEKSPKWNIKSEQDKHSCTYEQYLKELKFEHNMNEEQIGKMKNEIVRIVAYIFAAAIEKLDRYPGSFHLTGLDFMLDDNFKVYFLEANQNPRLQEKHIGEKHVSPQIAEDLVDIELQLQGIQDKVERNRLLQNPHKYFNLKGWEILINEAQNYNILSEIEQNELKTQSKRIQNDNITDTTGNKNIQDL